MSTGTGADKSKDYNALDRAEPTLPAAWYYDAARYEQELAAIWNQRWIYLCRSDVLAEPGVFRTLSIGPQNVFVVRTVSGSLAGYFNTCRHRGSAIVTDTEGRLRSKAVNCPYHGWCYSLEDGRLLATTSFAEPEGFDREAHGLYPIAVQEWRGFVFANLDPDAAWSPEAVFDAGSRNLEHFPLEDWVQGHHWSKNLDCNWKVFWENYNECLHCPIVHPALSELVPIFKRGLLEENDLPGWQDHQDDPDPKYRGGLRDGAETFSEDGSAQGYGDNPNLTAADIARGVTYAVALPSTYIGCHVDHARVVRILPTGPESIQMSVDWIFQREALADPDYDISKVTRFIQRVLEEDGYVCELNQRGLRSLPHERGVIMPEEYDVKHFRDWVIAELGD